jgi:hypothetical protein
MSKLADTLELLDRKAEEWLEEARASFWKDADKPYIPKWMRIYLVNNFQLEGILHGKIWPTNIPEGAKVYNIKHWYSDQTDDVFAMWMVHPDFPRYQSGYCVEAIPLQFEEVRK